MTKIWCLLSSSFREQQKKLKIETISIGCFTFGTNLIQFSSKDRSVFFRNDHLIYPRLVECK